MILVGHVNAGRELQHRETLYHSSVFNLAIHSQTSKILYRKGKQDVLLRPPSLFQPPQPLRLPRRLPNHWPIPRPHRPHRREESRACKPQRTASSERGSERPNASTGRQVKHIIGRNRRYVHHKFPISPLRDLEGYMEGYMEAYGGVCRRMKVMESYVMELKEVY